MVIGPLYLVFAALIAVFLCILVPTLLYLRQNAMRIDVDTANTKVSRALQEYATFCEEAQKLVKKISDAEAELHAAKTRDISTQETITKLSNKINSRVRAERKREQEVSDNGEEENIPGAEQQTIPFDFQSYNQPDPEESPPDRIRRFGELP